MAEDEKDLPAPSELMQILMDVGWVAIGRGMKANAESIFSGIAAARPNSELPLIGLAVCAINFGNFVGASKILAQKALPLNPNNGIARCFLAVAVRAIGEKDYALELANCVANECDDPVAVAFAKSLITGKDVEDPVQN
ncbi:MAG: hypothetical protein LBR91_01020 [Puniceicoccales bacterium]|jgi:Flp pilus assembly protein TadD|nr:hypothetical protein [Puniceicoccales bacterium]